MSDAQVLKLDRNSGIALAETLGHSLEEYFQAGTPTIIDASEVERVDTTTMQLLYSFMHSMKELGVEVTVEQPTEEFVLGAKRLGFVEIFNL